MLEGFLDRSDKAGCRIIENDDWRDLHTCLTCDDIRYTAFEEALMVDVFMKNEGVIREDLTLTIPMPKVRQNKGYYGNGDVQVREKAVLTEILKAGFYLQGAVLLDNTRRQ